MTITKEKNGNELIIGLEGWLDAVTSPELSEELERELDGVESLRFDFTKLEYVSSAGLRVLLSTQKKMHSKGTMVIEHPNSDIKELFEFTGFSEALTVVD